MTQCPLSRNEICSPISVAHSIPSRPVIYSNSQCHWVLGILKQIILSYCHKDSFCNPLCFSEWASLWFLCSPGLHSMLGVDTSDQDRQLDPLGWRHPLMENCRLENIYVFWRGGMHMFFGVMSHFVPNVFVFGSYPLFSMYFQ